MLTNVPLILVMLKLVVLTLLFSVIPDLPVLLIHAIQKSDVKPKMSNVMTTISVPLITVILNPDVLMNRLIVLTLTLALMNIVPVLVVVSTLL
jgi:hypothetical protein